MSLGAIAVMVVLGLLVFLFATLAKVFRIFTERCTVCGGVVSGHINGHDYCDNCHKRAD